MDEAVRILRDSVAPVMKQQAGFKGWFLLTEIQAEQDHVHYLVGDGC